MPTEQVQSRAGCFYSPLFLKFSSFLAQILLCSVRQKSQSRGNDEMGGSGGGGGGEAGGGVLRRTEAADNLRTAAAWGGGTPDAATPPNRKVSEESQGRIRM